MDPIIRFENVSKLYHIGRGYNLRGAINDVFLKIRRQKSSQGDFWALKDVSFRVNAGESIGILGHNGAGKTTILKLLSGITSATKGKIDVDGRVGTLIELGAGFHPEMTGRENVYLNGVILGLTKKEISRSFESIIEFAGIEDFIDTPVKRYSSGMYVRLAFAVAAHINPSILLVDEVLAVGDIAFRTKCYRRMAELRQNGTTIVLVSHDVYAIRDTCDRALLVWQSELIEDGPTESVITSYLTRMQERNINTDDQRQNDRATQDNHYKNLITNKVRIRKVQFFDKDNNSIDKINSGELLKIDIQYEAHDTVIAPIFRVDFYHDGRIYTGYSTAYDGIKPSTLFGAGKIELNIDELFLPPAIYSVTIVISDTYEYNLLDVHHKAYQLQVIRVANSRGEFSLPHSWNQEDLQYRGK